VNDDVRVVIVRLGLECEADEERHGVGKRRKRELALDGIAVAGPPCSDARALSISPSVILAISILPARRAGAGIRRA